MKKRIFFLAAAGVIFSSLLAGCVGLHQYNVSREEYIRTVQDKTGGALSDLCIIELDDEGELWDRAQLQDTLELIRKRNAESPDGIVVSVYIHGWKNNADWSREKGNLRRIADSVARSGGLLQNYAGDGTPRRVVGVYIGWRGDTARGWFIRDMTFWNRLLASGRVASIDLKETLSWIMKETKSRTNSKVILYGHSMGGRILFEAISEPLLAMSMKHNSRTSGLPIDLVILSNPAIRAVDVAHFVDLLKRYNVKLTTEDSDGNTIPADGPIIASITSSADLATRYAFPAGQNLARLFRSYREDERGGRPSQGYLSSHTDGHTDYLVSHRAVLRQEKIVLEEVPGRYNDTPYWVIRVGPEICRHHGDIDNPRMQELISLLLHMRDAYSATSGLRLTGETKQ